jgi:hypothetical protein
VSGFTEATLNIGGGLRVKDGIFRVRKSSGLITAKNTMTIEKKDKRSPSFCRMFPKVKYDYSC